MKTRTLIPTTSPTTKNNTAKSAKRNFRFALFICFSARIRMILSGVILPRLLAYGVNLSPDQYADRGG